MNRRTIRTAILLTLMVIFVSLCHAQSMMGLIAAKGSAGSSGITAVLTGDALCALGTANVVTLGPFDSSVATGGNLIFVYTSYHPAGAISAITDNKGNTYTALTTTGVGSAPDGRGFFVKNAAVGTGHTITIPNTGSSLIPGACAIILSGVSTSGGVDVTSTPTNDHTGTTIQGGTLTPSADNSVVLAGVNLQGTVSASSIDGGFTIAGKITGDGVTGYGVAIAYLIQTTAAAANPTWTLATNSVNDAINYAFK